MRWKDSNNQPIEVGDYVAYNWAGSVAAGYVVKITHYYAVVARVVPEPVPERKFVPNAAPGEPWAGGEYVDVPGTLRNPTSKVTNGRNMLILRKGP